MKCNFSLKTIVSSQKSILEAVSFVATNYAGSRLQAVIKRMGPTPSESVWHPLHLDTTTYHIYLHYNLKLDENIQLQKISLIDLCCATETKLGLLSRDCRKSQKHGSCVFRDFRPLPCFAIAVLFAIFLAF